MLTTDMSLKLDPEYKKISQRFLKNPKELERAFALAWFKLIHRDMGPRARYLGAEVPKEVLLWQDPIPKVRHALINASDAAQLKKKILASGLTVAELVRTAWAAAASYRGTDMRGGANGGRLRLAPQKDWPVNNPKELSKVLSKLDSIRKGYGKKVSMADLIVLAGAAAIEQASTRAGMSVLVPFRPGRADATQEMTDIQSFSVLEPKADGFRNFYSEKNYLPPIDALIDRANMLSLTVPEMTVLVGGMRVLGANSQGSKHGVFTEKPGTLTNDFFVNLLDMSTKWVKHSETEGIYEGQDRKTGKVKYTATPVDLVFGSSAELRSIAEVYAADDAKRKFLEDFVKAWVKVMQLDRFELKV